MILSSIWQSENLGRNHLHLHVLILALMAQCGPCFTSLGEGQVQSRVFCAGAAVALRYWWEDGEEDRQQACGPPPGRRRLTLASPSLAVLVSLSFPERGGRKVYSAGLLQGWEASRM